MQQKVLNYIEYHKLLTPKDLVIVGVSGGADSVALLHLLLSLGYHCVIAHCNFHLRTDESDRDEDFVRNLAEELKIPFYSTDFETSKYAESHHISIEMAARELRYTWFYELLEKLNAKAISVAHHADDSIETLLMNLVRGTGLRGLAGISPRNDKVVRPLLCCTRSEIENYISEHNLNNITDSSNATLDYQRNKFRNQVLPLLEEINPSVRQTLYDSIYRFEGTMAIYQQAIDKLESELVQKEGQIIKINIDLLKQQVHPPAIAYELLHPYGFSAASIFQICEHLDSESGKQFFSDKYRLIKDRRYLIISKNDIQNNSDYFISETETEILEPINLNICKLVVNEDFVPSKSPNCIHLDASKLLFPLQIRHWQEGDSFFPFGMNKQQKISDFFINNKFTLFEKENTWLLTSDNEIAWVIGQRTDNRFRVTKNTKEVIQFSIVEAR